MRTAFEARGAVQGWGPTELLPPDVHSVGAAIDIIAGEGPERLAIADGTRELSYAAVVTVMHRVAHAVAARHRDPASPVVALCEHGVSASLTVLGVLGAARLLVPLDVRDPTERLAAVVSASGATLVVTAPEHADRARAVAPHCELLLLDETDGFPDTPVAVDVRPESPGLVIFTSGSTGTPKGVVLSHGTLIANAYRQGWTGAMKPGDRMALSASFSYVGAYWPLLGCLSNGASVFTYDSRARGQRAYPAWVNANEIRGVASMVALLRSLADSPDIPRMDGVRSVRVWGDTVYGRDIVRFRPLFGPDTEFRVGFGSTECGSIASYSIPPHADPEPGILPFGAAVPWADVRIVDPETGDELPDGRPGRLEVASPYIALGYFNDPELTAAHFFTTPDGQRGYRSSDLVRRRADGVMEHLGRTDSRVKIRGALVAPGEVERALAEVDGVGAVTVVAVPAAEGGHRLVAYVVPGPGSALGARQLRRDVGRRWPTTMVPAAVVFLDELPLDANGKVDRSALPPAAEPVRAPYREPRGHERELADLFAEVLGVERVGRDDDFFDLGGDSLGAIELVAAIQERFGVEIVTSTILEAPTVTALAPRIGNRRDSHASVLVPLRAGGTAMPVFCFTGGGAPALSLRALAETMAAAGPEERPFYALQPRGLEERALPDRSISAAARRGLHAIRSALPTGPFVLGGYSFGGVVAFDLACRMQADGLRLPLLVLMDAVAPGVRPRRTRGQRLEQRGREVRVDTPAGPLRKSTTMLGRSAQIAWSSANAHAERRVSLAGAGLFPRRGLEQYELFLRLSSAMARAYRPKRTFDGPVIVVRSDVPPAGYPRADLGWSNLVTGPITVVDVPGDHLSMIRRPHVAILGSRLAHALEGVA